MKKVMPKLGALIVIALLASGGTGSLAAEGDAKLSGSDVLDQAVALYEKLQHSEVEIPAPLTDKGIDEHLLKSVVLGYVNLDETETAAKAAEVSKQDVMTILYKTIINYDGTYAISEEEADDILNNCYDNAYIDEENRLAYAFMIKQGIISNTAATEPDKALTWDSCRILVDLIYDYFIQETTITVNNIPVTMGSHVSKITETLGEPNRIDKSDFGFEWYVYDADYSKFVMVGVDGDRVCALYTNSDSFEYNGVKSGDDFSSAETVGNLKFTEDGDGKIDSVLYNPRSEGQEDSSEINKLRSRELLDIVNAYRTKHGLKTYTFSEELADTAWLRSADFAGGGTSDDAYQQSGYDIFAIYKKLVKEHSELLTADYKENTVAGVSAPLNDSVLYASFVVDESTRIRRDIEQVSKTDKLFGFLPSVKAENEEKEKPSELINVDSEPQLEEIMPDEYGAGDDIVLDLKEKTADKYHLEVYDIEEQAYAVNSYITTKDTSVSVPADLLTEGKDYTVKLSSVAPDGEEFPSEEQFVSYGSAYETGISIIGPSSDKEYTTDNDYIALQWNSELYHDFYVDVYNSDGELVVSTIVEDENSAIIRGVDPGDYYVYVTALRRGTIVEKAQDMINVHITMPEPVINEFILDKDDKYYFVYEDSSLGVLYFYDEELVDVEENGKTVKKKKIIQKQVKSTKAYRNLAQYRDKPEYTTGDTTPRVKASEKGTAIVEKAKQYMGVPYVWGGSTPAGFDCSGLVQYVLNSLGIQVSRVTYTQINDGTAVTRSELAPGDLVFFANNGDVHHVGIYIGNDEFIHAPHTGDVVKISSLNEAYYAKEYCGARRVY